MRCIQECVKVYHGVPVFYVNLQLCNVEIPNPEGIYYTAPASLWTEIKISMAPPEDCDTISRGYNDAADVNLSNNFMSYWRDATMQKLWNPSHLLRISHESPRKKCYHHFCLIFSSTRKFYQIHTGTGNFANKKSTIFPDRQEELAMSSFRLPSNHRRRAFSFSTTSITWLNHLQLVPLNRTMETGTTDFRYNDN